MTNGDIAGHAANCGEAVRRERHPEPFRSRSVPTSRNHVDELSVGKIWALDDVIAWAERSGRTLDLAALSSIFRQGQW